MRASPLNFMKGDRLYLLALNKLIESLEKEGHDLCVQVCSDRELAQLFLHYSSVLKGFLTSCELPMCAVSTFKST